MEGLIVADTEPQFTFAVTAKLRHGELWKLVKQFGSQAALARYLGIHPTQVGRMVNMRGKPPSGAKWWNGVMEKLLTLTGKSAEELFPDWLHSQDFLDMPKSSEQFRRLPASALNRIAQSDGSLSEQLRLDIDKALGTLSHREREIMKMRYLDVEPYTLREVGEAFKLSPERVRQIENKAIRKLGGVLTLTEQNP